jgi:putative phosphoribosyl transferase
MFRFRDRREAGARLARPLAAVVKGADVLVLGIARGGVVVAAPVARELGAPLDVLVVRKLGVPGHEELAMGAIGHGGIRVMNWDVVDDLSIDQRTIDRIAKRETAVMERRRRAYRGDASPPRVTGRTVIVVDDGLATGATMRAALLTLRRERPAALIAAAPVGALTTCAMLEPMATRVICLIRPRDLWGVGAWYEDFAPTTDEEIRDLLRQPAPA